MAKSFVEDLRISSKLFLDGVWPRVASWCRGGEVLPVEIGDDETCKALDILAGIDLWQVSGDHGVRGIGSRVQYGASATNKSGRPWDTFTIRVMRESGVATEFDKRLSAIRNGDWLYPHLTVQAYFQSECPASLLSCGMVRTSDLMGYLAERRSNQGEERWMGELRSATDASNGRWAKFDWVKWDELTRGGVSVKRWSKQGQESR